MNSDDGQRHWSGAGVGAQLRSTEKSLPVEARLHNRHLILRTLFHSGAASRAQLARLTGLTAGTMSTLVRELADDDLIEETAPLRSRKVGKPSTPIRIKKDAYWIAALDLSDPEEVIGALVNLHGEVVWRTSRSIGFDSDPVAVVSLGRELISAASRPVLGLGVSCPGIIDPEGRVIWTTTYQGWNDFQLRTCLRDQLDLQVAVANDANAATLAEFTFGGAPGDGMMTITLGHGVGAGLMLGGVLILGEESSVGEIGHITAVARGLPCECGRNGCLQTILSAPLLRLLNASQDRTRQLRDLHRIGKQTGMVLAPLVGALTLREVRISARVGLMSDELLLAIEATIRGRVLPSSSPGVSVRRSSLGDDAQVLGGAALVLSSELGIA